MPRKSHHEDDDEMVDDDEKDDEEESEDEDEEDDDDEDTIDLDQAEEEEEDDDDSDDDDDDEDQAESVEDMERRRLFQNESEELLENLTLDDVREVLRENDMDENLAPKLKKLLADVINEGEVDNLDDAWDEALERLEE